MEPEALERLEKEEKKLAKKLNALFEFIHGPQWSFVGKHEQDLLLEQHEAMSTYLDCVRERVVIHTQA